MVTELSNHVRGVLKVFGLVVEGARGGVFADRVEALATGRPEVAAVVRPMLDAWRGLRRQVAAYDAALRAEAKQRREVRLLMSVPGVGAITALAFAGAVDDPSRFSSSRDVGAHFGLTPRRHQSGEVDRIGATSRWGDGLVRTYPYEAANVLPGRVQRWSPLKAWAVRLAQRSGGTKARVALARKLAVVMHAIWRSGDPFRWTAPAAGQARGREEAGQLRLPRWRGRRRSRSPGRGHGQSARGPCALRRRRSSAVWTLDDGALPEPMMRRPRRRPRREP